MVYKRRITRKMMIGLRGYWDWFSVDLVAGQTRRGPSAPTEVPKSSVRTTFRRGEPMCSPKTEFINYQSSLSFPTSSFHIIILLSLFYLCVVEKSAIIAGKSLKRPNLLTFASFYLN